MEKIIKKTLIEYFKSLGIDVYTNTKARGHQGFFLKNRIDISKNTKEERIVPTLLHEFAHYIHSQIEPDMAKTGGSLEALFEIGEMKKPEPKQPKYVILSLFKGFKNEEPDNSDLSLSENEKDFISKEIIQEELLQVTNFVDANSHLVRLKNHKEQIKKKIKSFEAIIKQDYPKFMRSKKFKDFDKYIKKSKAKYLLKYDRVKFITPFLRNEEFYSIDTIESDFPDMPQAFCAYIRLKSSQRKQGRISARMNNLNKYYAKPTELFSRFVECLYIDESKAQSLAPHTTQMFYELLENGYYLELKKVFEMLQADKSVAIF